MTTVYFNRQKIFVSENKNPTPTEASKQKTTSEEKTNTSNNQPTATTAPTVAPTTSEFANWINYRNDRFKYQLKYDPS